MIGGNTEFTIQKISATQNEFGEDIKDWIDMYIGKGFLDMMSGEANRTFNAKIEQSSHVIVCDYVDFSAIGINAENSRVVIDDEPYQVTYIDDPMRLHKHLEIFLKYLGGM